MEKWISRLVAVGTKIQTPLGLAGAVVVVLYATLSQILKLDIFSNIGSDGTFAFLSTLLNYLFYLAILSIILAVFSYVLALWMRLRPPPRLSNLELIHGGLDRGSSDYVTDDEDSPNATIRHRSRTKSGGRPSEEKNK